MSYLINMVTTETNFHQHNEYEIVICTKGEGVFSLGADHPFTRGSIVLIPPKFFHKITIPEELERIFIRGDFDHLFTLDAPVILRDNAEQEGAMLAQMMYRNRFANPEYLSALVDAFMLFIMQSIKTEDRLHMAIGHIVNQITTGFYNCDIDLKALLEDSGYAEDYVRACFKKATGKTPHELLTQVRIRHACFLIDIYGKNMPLSEIAEKCGYTDYVYFSKKFKSVTGFSPRKYMEDTFNYDR